MSSMGLLLVVVFTMWISVAPIWPYSRAWGCGPSGLLGFVLAIVFLLTLLVET